MLIEAKGGVLTKISLDSPEHFGYNHNKMLVVLYANLGVNGVIVCITWKRSL